MAARALIRESDLRRWAKIAREERVTIHGQVNPNGVVSIHMSAAPEAMLTQGDNDLDSRLADFGAM